MIPIPDLRRPHRVRITAWWQGGSSVVGSLRLPGLCSFSEIFFGSGGGHVEFGVDDGGDGGDFCAEFLFDVEEGEAVFVLHHKGIFSPATRQHLSL